MSYLALARKWRPIKFNQVVGQAHVLTALENALGQNRLHHAYLFSGTRGVGKTSIGRLFAKGLNCETGITATPCGECTTCREIDEGRFVDLLEIDAASRTKVEDTRELLDNVQYKPARGRFKVYLIDEVHMLSRHSFNALLKTLEEPPEYVKFLLATTDPQKLPVTILSRCLQFHLKPISVDDIHQQLEDILKQEHILAEARALGMISHAADGSMRDALSLTDQAIALGNGEVRADLVSHMLGTLDTDQAIHLLEAISSKQPQTAMDSLQTLAQNGVEWDGLLQQLATQLHRLAMYQALPATLDKSQPDAEKIELLSTALSPQDIQLYYQIVLKGRSDLALSPTARLGVEMIVLRMMAFRPAVNAGAQVISVEQSAAQPTMNVNSVPVNAPSQPQSVATTPAPVEQARIPSRQATPPTAPSSAPQQQVAPMPPQYDERNAPPPSYSAADYHDNGQPPYQSEAAPAAPSENKPATLNRSAPASPVSGLRHQLRSQRNSSSQSASGQGASPQGGSAPKKANAASAKTSVIERVAQKHSGSAPVSPMASNSEKVDADDAYRWRPSQPVVKQEKSNELTPTQIKQALEHVKTPEMAEILLQESVKSDAWSAMITQLNTGKLVEQLALNSVFKQDGNAIELMLRTEHKHLNTDRAQSDLLAALNHHLGQECYLTVTLGEDGETPLELREKIYQGKLQSAFTSLESDSNVQFLERRFAAVLDRDSVRPI
ncbi:DNA polymerase III subunit gamma/tau [Vibrio sp. 10N.286.49.B3]|uniref:DNA polymerase III subunit gamma/tau n=1 Tax=Vibrio sp. 10N.286.49.B3 TaxID=1880855 RepID=UPI000C82459B|nr:DNA polymerase III subunit gamma/tau [Vibrio sp. 10N.286.49.B3]PMH40582.1 DNA polymerase III subunit gamma/tau [Vibrio sp. 10N.286.49.B3]